MQNQVQTTQTADAGQTTSVPILTWNCTKCGSSFVPTSYKVKKHYHVCDACIFKSREALAKAKAGAAAFVAIAKSVQPIATSVTALPVEVKEPRATEPKPESEKPKRKAEDYDASAEYVPQNGEVEDLKRNIQSGLNTLLTGPTQCGKTTLAYFVAKELGRDIYTIQGGAGATFERIVAKDALEEQNGVTVTVRPSATKPSTWSVLPQAMENGAILYVDEPNVIPSEVLMYLFSAMDWRHTITFDDGTVLTAKDGFCVICAMNEGQGYTGTSLLNAAFRARSQAIIDMEYLPAVREAALIVDRTGIDKDMARKLADAASSLRASLKAKTIRTPIGTSAVLACGMLIKNGCATGKAVRMTITNQVPSTMDKERGAVEDVLSAYFGKEIR